MSSIRLLFRNPLMIGCALLALGCTEEERGPVRLVAIGPEPALVNPNRDPVSPAAAMLLEATAQGLVRFDAAGEIEPALAQSWRVSTDGRRYTFRLQRTTWSGGEPVTAQQVAERLQAAVGRNSRNPLRPILGSIELIEARTEHVLEIRLVAPRGAFLQLLAQPELAILRNGQGTGPYEVDEAVDGELRLVPPTPEDEEEAASQDRPPDILLSGGSAARAIARFRQGRADLVTGGTLGELPLLAAAQVPGDRIAYDPTAGLLGLAFTSAEGPLAQPETRQALSMAVDRDAIAARFGVPALQVRAGIVPAGLAELPAPAQPDWAAAPIEERRARAATLISEAADVSPLRLRIGIPDRPGYRLLFAHIRRDWRLIGVDAVRVPAGAPAELRLVDMVAPAELASWYLRPFLCGQSAVCDPVASQLIEAARSAATPAERQALFAQADSALAPVVPFIAIGSPLRWSLRSERMTSFRVNPFARHSPTELIRRRN